MSTTIDLRTYKGFEKAYNLYSDKIYSICKSRLNNKEVAEEIVHEIFKSLWERRDSIQIQESMEHYLIRAAKLKIIDYYRQKERDSRHLECKLHDYCGYEHCTENQVEFNELKNQLTLLVDKLPCQCQQVYLLSREKGMSNKEIASHLLLSEKTVEYHMSKALAFLKKQLSEFHSLLVFLISFFI